MNDERTLPGVYTAGVVLTLVGVVLPWLREHGVNVWAWDVSVVWAVTGRASLVHAPPAAGAIVLVAAVVLALPVLRGGRVNAPVAAAIAAFTASIAGLTLVRALTLPRAVPPHAGLVLTLAGTILAAAGALAAGDD